MLSTWETEEPAIGFYAWRAISSKSLEGLGFSAGGGGRTVPTARQTVWRDGIAIAQISSPKELTAPPPACENRQGDDVERAAWRCHCPYAQTIARFAARLRRGSVNHLCD